MQQQPTLKIPEEEIFPAISQSALRILRMGTGVETGICTVGVSPARLLWDCRETVQMSCVRPSTLRVLAQPWHRVNVNTIKIAKRTILGCFVTQLRGDDVALQVHIALRLRYWKRARHTSSAVS